MLSKRDLFICGKDAPDLGGFQGEAIGDEFGDVVGSEEPIEVGDLWEAGWVDVRGEGGGSVGC